MTMINLKTELEEIFDQLGGTSNILWAKIRTDELYAVLKPNFDIEEYNSFMRDLNFQYYKGYGGQNVFGSVMFKDGTWLERGEYDGSQWWEHKEPPSFDDEIEIY